jgi:signal transduction histidine kinase
MVDRGALDPSQAEELAVLRRAVDALRERVTELETLAIRHRAAEAKLAWLATFPEQNPNLVIETDAAGRVTYLNPVAQATFPELWTAGFRHPLLRDLEALIAAFEGGGHPYVAREIDSGDTVFEQKICYTKQDTVVRIRVYASDITRRKRAEEAIQRLAKQLVFAQEEERHRVSRELHDEAGQALTALQLSLTLIQRELPPGAEAVRQNLVELVALADTTRERIRLLALNLRPPALDTLGLNLTLDAVCRDFSKRTDLAIRYDGVEVTDLPAAMTICLYRILQEALTNVARHADASRVDVQLGRDDRTVFLVVEDDGRGLENGPAATRDRGPTLGLVGMRERLEMFGGWLEVDSAANVGTRLVARLPV